MGVRAGRGPALATLALVAALVGVLLAPPALAGAALSRVRADPILSTVPPEITGAAVFGTRLRTSTGTWTPDGLVFSYRWRRDGTAIRGETGRAYRLAVADLGHRISATVTATDSEGASLSVTTAPTARVVRASLESRNRPEITGVLRYTRRLTATRGEWSRRPDRVRFHWLRDGRPIRGATRQRYLLQPRDVGARVSVAVTVRREGHLPATATSAATARVGHRVPVRRTVTYRVETRGRITASLATFRRQVLQTYRDPRGWRSAGIAFRPVRKGGSFSVVLAEASWVPRFSSVCSAQWSCRVGRYVIINQTRWRNASPAWRAGHQPLRGYRHMVVNHETGHWLGHGHRTCPGAGRLAPVMMQQSKGLGRCRFNPWPLASELWSRSRARGRCGLGWHRPQWIGPREPGCAQEPARHRRLQRQRPPPAGPRDLQRPGRASGVRRADPVQQRLPAGPAPGQLPPA